MKIYTFHSSRSVQLSFNQEFWWWQGCFWWWRCCSTWKWVLRFIPKRKTPLYCCCWCTCWKCNVFMAITTWMHYRSILHLEQLPWICMQHCLSGRVQWQLKHIHYLWTRFIPNHFAWSLHPSLLSSKCWPSISELPKEKPTPTSPCVLSRRIQWCFRCCQDRITACPAPFLPTFHISQP